MQVVQITTWQLNGSSSISWSCCSAQSRPCTLSCCSSCVFSTGGPRAHGTTPMRSVLRARRTKQLVPGTLILICLMTSNWTSPSAQRYQQFINLSATQHACYQSTGQFVLCPYMWPVACLLLSQLLHKPFLSSRYGWTRVYCALQRGSCCEVCGIIAHESCARHVPDDCRPIALSADKVLHTWKAAGTVLNESQVTDPPSYAWHSACLSSASGDHLSASC